MDATVTLPPTTNYDYKRQWNLKTIWELSEDLEIAQIEVNQLWDTRYSRAWCWQQNDEEINNLFFLHHLNRVMHADLNYPIILSEENYILDGVHRLMRAKYLGLKSISFVRFTKDPTPDINTQ